jgi:hypothetical protein
MIPLNGNLVCGACGGGMPVRLGKGNDGTALELPASLAGDHGDFCFRHQM